MKCIKYAIKILFLIYIESNNCLTFKQIYLLIKLFLLKSRKNIRKIYYGNKNGIAY